MNVHSSNQRPVRPARERGFTLIEIMLVVVIIGVLSTFSLPYFQKVTARARRAEANIVLDKLHVYFVNQYETSGSFNTSEVVGMLGAANGSSVWNPDPGTVTGQPANWITQRTGWQQIPFSFDGGLKLRFAYNITDNNNMTISVVGEMPGMGPDLSSALTTVGGVAVTGNYLYTEVLTAAPGSGVYINPPVEIPAM